MKIKTCILDDYKELEIHVCKNANDSEVKDMVSTLHELFDQNISGTDEKGNKVKLIPSEIVSFYASNQKVFALDSDRQYTVSMKLYELEERLKGTCFTRISKSELINYKKIKSMDMSMTGTIRLTMKNGYETFTSRRNVMKIKELLTKGGK